MPEKEPAYPWLRLLETELQQEPKPVKRRRAGRPKNTFARRRVRMSLTSDEQYALDHLVELLSERMGRTIHRGHLIAFMTFRLRNQLQRGQQIVIPEDVDSFVALAKHLDSASR
jgi:bisphosphoglycerate-dependent phosphoglycerate mutase